MSVRALQKIQAPSLNCLGRALLAGTLRKTRLLQMGVQATFLSAAQHAPHSLGSLEPRKAAELSQSVSSARLLSSPAAGSTAVRAARTCGKAQRMFFVERSPDANRIESLQRIAGIGPRNSQRLVSAGIDSVTRLRELFRDSNNADKMKMLACSQEKVGISSRRQCSRTVSHLADLEPKRERCPERSCQKVTLCVEGNISAGKSTFLKELLKSSVELRDIVEVVPEPVHKWQNIQGSNGGETFNLLEAFYNEPGRFAYTFQNYVFVTRLIQAKDSEGCAAPLRLLERSVFSDRMVFVRAVHEARWLSEMELSIYDSWFDHVVSTLKALVPDGFIYLAASPETCMRRMSARGRGEEGAVSLEYLSNLHSKHEEWLHSGMLRPDHLEILSDSSKNRNNSSPSNLCSTLRFASSAPPEEPESIRGKIFYLDHNKQPLLQRHIDGLPALYLDCDKDIDMKRDQAAKDIYVKQIMDFSDHVRKIREARHAGGIGECAAKGANASLIAWQQDRLWWESFLGSAEQSRQHASP